MINDKIYLSISHLTGNEKQFVCDALTNNFLHLKNEIFLVSKKT